MQNTVSEDTAQTTRVGRVPTLSKAFCRELRSRVRGRVVGPADTEYDSARRAWNLSVDQHPTLIVAAESAEDIAEAVLFARDYGLGVAVQATGHGIARPADGCLLLLTGGMKRVSVNAAARTAWIEAGATWGEVLPRTQASGLAPLLGSSVGVGAVGYTLGGGLGWLARKYGMAAGSVRHLELVTADGVCLRAGAAENPELFWALRGGGGGFGVVTAMEVGLYPVTTVYGGNLVYPIETAEEVLARFRDWIRTLPPEMTSSVVLVNFPPVPEVPEFLRGRSVVMVRGCCCGPVEQGEALMREWRDWRPPLADMFKPIPFAEVGSISNDPRDPMPGLAGGGAWMRYLDDEAAGVLLRYGARNGVSGEARSPLIMTEVRHVEGAGDRGGSADTALGSGDAPLLLELVGMTPTPESYHDLRRYIEQVVARLQPCLTGRVYPNFLEGEERWARSRDAYSPEAYRRLRLLKASFDPDNVFRFSLNFPPPAAVIEEER